MRRRLRLCSHALGNSARDALWGYTFVTINTRSRRPSIASATTFSAPPSPYISAVSINVNPSSIPKRSAATSSPYSLLFSPMPHVPWPSTGTRLPSGSATVFIHFNRIWKPGTQEKFLSNGFETRSFPNSLVAYPRDFAFYVADPSPPFAHCALTNSADTAAVTEYGPRICVNGFDFAHHGVCVICGYGENNACSPGSACWRTVRIG